MSKKTLLFFLIFSIASFLHAKTYKLTLKQAEKMAIEHNPEILQEVQKVEQAKSRMNMSYSAYFPSIDLSGYRVMKEKVMTIIMPSFIPGQPPRKIEMDFTRNYQMTLQFAQPLFTGGAIFFNSKLATALEKAQESLLQAKKNEIRAKTKTVFYSIILLKKSKEIVLNGLKFAKDTKEKIAVMYSQGLVKKLDLLRAKNKVREMDAKLKEIDSKLFEAKNNLKNIIGISLKDNVEIIGQIKEYPAKLNPELLKKQMETNNPILKSLVQQKKVSSYNLKLAYSKFLPTLAIGGQYNFRGDSFSNLSDWDNYYSINLTLSFSIFKGFSKKFNLTMAKAQKEETEIKVAAYEKNMKANLMNLIKKNNYLLEKIKIARDNFENTKEELEIAKTSYKEGLISYTDLELIENQNLSAELNYYQSIFELYTNIFTIETFISDTIIKF